MPILVLSRSIDDQLASLTQPERLAFDTLREYWDSKKDKLVEYDDYMILLLLRASPGDFKFNVKAAIKVAEKFAHYSLQYNISALRLEDVQEMVDKRFMVLSPNGSLRNKDGDVIMYYRAQYLLPAKTSIDALLQFVAYQLACLTSEEDAAVNGICVLANTENFAMANFSLQMYKALITFLLGRAPLRVRRVAIFNANMATTMAFNMVRPLLGGIANKVVFVSREKIHFEFPDAKTVPKECGGELDLDQLNDEFIEARRRIESQ